MPALRVLVIWPPQVLSYFNAGHHNLIYSVASYLRRLPEVERVDTLDASVESRTWKEVGDLLHQGGYDVVAITNDLDGVDGLTRFLTYARQLAPQARLVTFGRLSGMQPEIFTRFDLDAIVGSGDYEPGVAAFVRAVAEDRAAAGTLPGVWLRTDGDWAAPAAPGGALSAADWVMPEVSEIPYHAYDWLYRDDQNKFCGIPGRRELVVPAARGCPVGCDYCEVPAVFGKPDRRASVEHVVEYIERSFAELPFEYVAFYAPTFTLNRAWTVRLCEQLVERGARYPWKCATTVHHLDEELVALMGRSGCVRISVGVETLAESGHAALPRLKRKSEDAVEALATWCARAGVELNCFVIVGLPGTSVADAEAAVDRVRAVGGRVRPTMYSPHELLHPGMSVDALSLHNRQILPDGVFPDPAERQRAYDIVFGRERHLTRVGEQVRERRGTDSAASSRS
ncbi:B12-binding domain-containing radical SAM protein [Streptomyces sp. NPDC056149]|uniref:B12-binding domain-containing radical SAM protein n=1 Tax=unclassified Streptomyces TaxID=2593676 RepID=UPI0023812933|nr:radical SAM protein [Streptomyces sp. WZ-12]